MSDLQKLNDELDPAGTPVTFPTTSSSTDKKLAVEINLESTLQCTPITDTRLAKPDKPMLAVHSEGNIKKREQASLKQKLVNKVKSWSSKDGKSMGSRKPEPNLANITVDLENLNLLDSPSEEKLYKTELLKAKDSLESLLGSKNSKVVRDSTGNSKSVSHASTSNERHFCNNTVHSDLILGGIDMESVTKVIAWDPWNKMARKNKKDQKANKKELKQRRKPDRSPVSVKQTKASSMKTKEVKENEYDYQLYNSNRKSVEFVNDVLVIYFTSDEIVTKGTEPLKKGLEQQIRNKEMRRGHVPCTLISYTPPGDMI